MITYDESKRLLNLKKHYLDFIGCEAVFAGFTLTREDKHEDYGEMRFQTLGLWNETVVFIVHTPRGEHEHIISIRNADWVGVTGLRLLPLPHHRTCGFPHPAVESNRLRGCEF